MARAVQDRPSSLVKGVLEPQDESIWDRIESTFESFASRTSRIIGTPYSFAIATITILLWAILGPIFHYSDAWQLVINTGTTIITFLMVFLLQHQQNKDSLAIQLKLDEIIGAVEGASNQMINIEELSERDLSELKARYQKLVEELSRREEYKSVSVTDSQRKVNAQPASDVRMIKPEDPRLRGSTPGEDPITES